MPDLPPIKRLLTEAPERWHHMVILDYDQRLVRRKRLVTQGGEGFMVDLANVTNLDDFAGFELTDGSFVRIVPAEEEVLIVTGDLPRLAWHIGNRHTPCRIESDRLVIRADHVLEAMLRQLGASLASARMPFVPEGGAYGTGRTMGHAHGHANDTDDRHSHGPATSHDLDLSHGQHTHPHD